LKVARKKIEQCVERYIKLAGSKIVGKIKPCTTPFLDESKAEFDENDVIAKIKAARTALPADVTPAQIAAVSQGEECYRTLLLPCL
jgi:hypothetical protein